MVTRGMCDLKQGYEGVHVNLRHLLECALTERLSDIDQVKGMRYDLRTRKVRRNTQQKVYNLQSL